MMIFIIISKKITTTQATVVCSVLHIEEREKKYIFRPPLVGIEPTIFGLEVQRVNPLRHRGFEKYFHQVSCKLFDSVHSSSAIKFSSYCL